MANMLARKLRNNGTEAERRLWQELKLLRAEGYHFRRQVPLGAFIADFACHRNKLIVEVDGGQHGEDKGLTADVARTALLAKNGYRVLRFWNIDVFTSMEGVIDMIRNACGLETFLDYSEAGGGATPTPDPSPQGGGE